MVVEKENKMGILYWNGIAPKFMSENAWAPRVFYDQALPRDTVIASLFESEQWREVSFWLGRVSDIEEAQ